MSAVIVWLPLGTFEVERYVGSGISVMSSERSGSDAVQGLFCSRGLFCSSGLFCSYLLLFCSPGTILFTQLNPP